jgi:RimJ/RimL family protein N-acetyltransferase
MRRGVLHLAFCELGAFEAHSPAHPENTPSQRVSEKLGYSPSGRGRVNLGGGHVWEGVRYRLVAERFEPHPNYAAHGLTPALRGLFGASPHAPG